MLRKIPFSPVELVLAAAIVVIAAAAAFPGLSAYMRESWNMASRGHVGVLRSASVYSGDPEGPYKARARF